MVMIWRGYGYLVPVFGLFGYAFYHLLADAVGLPDTPAAMAVCVLVGWGIWEVGKRKNNPARARVLVDLETGETVRLVERHDLFWIAMEYWCVVPALVWLWLLGGWLLSLLAQA